MRCCTGVPSHAGYEALDNEAASWGEAEEDSELEAPYVSLSQESKAADWGYEAPQRDQDTKGHLHYQPAPDCHPSIPTIALLLEKPEGSPSVTGSFSLSRSVLKLERADVCFSWLETVHTLQRRPRPFLSCRQVMT